MIYLWAFITLLIYIYMYYSDPRRKIDKMFPGPVRVPFFGNALSILATPRGMYQIYLNWPKYYMYKVFRLWVLYMPYIVVPDYKVAKLILSSGSCVDKADDYKYFEPWLGKEFVFTGPKEPWKRSRKPVTPAFHFTILNQYFPVFDENAKIFCNKLEKHKNKPAFDVAEYVALYALDNVSGAAMGVNFQAQNDPESSYVKAVKNMVTVVYYRIFLLWLRSDKIFKISSAGRMQEKSLKILHGYSNDVIQARKNQLRQIKLYHEMEKEMMNSKEKKAFIDSLLENGQAMGFSDDEIRQTVDGVMFAGHDTISSSLGFLLYVLAEHQDVQEKIYQELESIFEKSDRCPTMDDLKAMKYTEQAIKESLRLYTTAPVIARKLNEELYINEKQHIPKNMTVVILLGSIHRDPELWPDPEKFDPERFSPEASQNRDPYAFLAFSAGPRNCIGQKFAMYEMKITLYRTLRKYKLCLSDDPNDKIDVRFNLIMTSANGIKIKVLPRDSNSEATTYDC